jgi:hypothetical protein
MKWLEHIIKHKTPHTSFKPEDWKTFNIFIIHRMLSMNPDYLEIVDYISGLGIDDKEKIYRIYCNIIPKNNRVFFPYIKSKIESKNEKLLDYISNFYMCGKDEAAEYLDILKKDDILDLLRQYGLEDKEISKLLK